ncbi:dihydrolipoyl dehydrogenase [Paludibacterium paludis]|uniref:Dihydrolipoyl dehydrogenase n=1 Tax=Paludibacterium paludis TaxID=1225769 RepID=A0A918UAX1_9NEIS|nr:dihydrolipoyl dehydrogenase [Paludibacterium paludis]GGY25446.1 dihydrolipoyl dehydrogenase [Paludibacterium paludis]
MGARRVDVAVIGAGTAGLAAYRAAVARGASAVIIEGGEYGTTCARVGCMPSKLLIAAADAAHDAVRGEPFGVSVTGGVVIDGAKVMRRVRAERDRFVGFVTRGMESIPEQNRLRGYARFIADRLLDVDGHTRIEARAVVIATGASPSIPPMLEGLGSRLVVNDDVFAWDSLPRSVAVFGPGVIGLELGQALSRLGVRVRVFGMSGSLGSLSDPEVKATAKVALSRELALDAEVRVDSLESAHEGVVIRYRDKDGVHVNETFEFVLAATGRTPNVARLALDNTSLALDARGVPLFDPRTLACSGQPVFLAGDANHFRPLLHEAADEGRAAGDNAALWPHCLPLARRAPLSVVFTDPQIMLVGARFAELDPDAVVIGRVDFSDQGRSRVMLVNEGVLRIYADKPSGRFLGAEMIGPGAEHLAHLLAWSVQQKLTLAAMLSMPFYHPVIEEGVRTALRDAERQRQI